MNGHRVECENILQLLPLPLEDEEVLTRSSLRRHVRYSSQKEKNRFLTFHLILYYWAHLTLSFSQYPLTISRGWSSSRCVKESCNCYHYHLKTKKFWHRAVWGDTWDLHRKRKTSLLSFPFDFVSLGISDTLFFSISSPYLVDGRQPDLATITTNNRNCNRIVGRDTWNLLPAKRNISSFLVIHLILITGYL